MSQNKPQSFRNHTAFDPSFHIVLLPLLLVDLCLGIIFLVMNLHSQLLLGFWIVVMCATVVLATLKTRQYSAKVQDRIIRLEERLRLYALLPEPLKKRIPELTESQLIGLRFASDDELPSLVELALDKHLDRKEIKSRIQNWRPDYFRI